LLKAGILHTNVVLDATLVKNIPREKRPEKAGGAI
jgi:hypothetical protein